MYIMSTAGDNVGQRLAQGYINSDGNGLCDYDYDESGVFLGYDLECEAGQIYGMTEHLPWRPHTARTLQWDCFQTILEMMTLWLQAL